MLPKPFLYLWPLPVYLTAETDYKWLIYLFDIFIILLTSHNVKNTNYENTHSRRMSNDSLNDKVTNFLN